MNKGYIGLKCGICGEKIYANQETVQDEECGTSHKTHYDLETPAKFSHTEGNHQAVRTTVHLTSTEDFQAIRDGRKKYMTALAGHPPYREHDMVIIRTVSGQELHRKITYIETVEKYQILSLKKV